MLRNIILSTIAIVCISMSGCLATQGDLNKTEERIKAVAGDLQGVRTNLQSIDKNQKGMQQQSKKLTSSLNATSDKLSSINSKLDTSVIQLKSSIDGIGATKNVLGTTTSGIDSSVVNIKGQTSKISNHATSLPDTLNKLGILQSAKNIFIQAGIIAQFNQQNKKLQVALTDIAKQLQKTNANLQIAQKDAKDAHEQAEKSKAQAKAITQLNQKNIVSLAAAKKLEQQASKKALSAASSASADAKKLEDLKNAQQQKIYTILYIILGVSVLAMAGGIAGAVTMYIPPRLGIMSVIGGGILFAVSAAMIRWLQQFQIVGMILIAILVLGAIIYAIYHLSVAHKANGQLVQLIDHSKNYLTDQGKKTLFEAQNNVAKLMQSNTTKKIVDNVQKSIKKTRTKLDI